MDLKYGDKIIEMEGVIVEVSDGAIAIDFKGRLGYLRIPRRMIISDYELKVGQEVGLNMSFVEVLSDKINEKYVSNLQIQKRRGIEPEDRWK
ncbi:CBO2463/CBO2479 domain-containing protein [Clostridium botulinum]|uniref:CBO2463/CBO2479 domain-containing protein n=1 Tax=Clostridium botulinum TaxID=1491 RepID=UPI0007739800|nr:CBO2463/CBO2479 domain-containing protein [Clostridium botulinum]